MHTPMVSVIIPAYNSQAYIQKAIDSVYNQAYQNIEVIVVDDGSTDGTLEVLSSNLSRPHYRYYHQKNFGPSAARNKGLREAKGQYVCFLDADDELLKGSIHRRVKVLEKYPQVDLIFTDVIRLDKAKTPGYAFLKHHEFTKKFKPAVSRIKEDVYFFNDRYFDCAMKYFPFIWTSSVMIRKEMVHSIGYLDESIRGSEDIDYWLRVAKKGKVAYIDAPLTAWHHYYSTLTRPGNYDFYRDTLICYKNLRKNLGEKKYLRRVINKRLAHYAFAGGYEAINEKALSQARVFFIKACYYRPLSLKNWAYTMISLMPKTVFYTLRDVKQSRQKRAMT